MSNHSHDHAHGHHHHVHTNNKKVLLISFIIIAGFMMVEIIGGFFANSLALLSDGVHMFSDALSLGVALIAFKYAEKHATLDKTFGYKRFEILAALFNGVTLIVLSIVIIYESIQRFITPPEVLSKEMFIISVIGLLVNIVVVFIMMRGGDTSHNINMRGAFLHVIGDLLGSVGAIVAAILIWAFNFTWADPLASLIVSLLILKSGWGITKIALNILMEGTPKDVNVDEVVQKIKAYPEIEAVHDCHIWTISNGLNALSCHAVVSSDLTIEEGENILKEIEHDLAHANIHHVTIQLESPKHEHDESTLCAGCTGEPHVHAHAH